MWTAVLISAVEIQFTMKPDSEQYLPVVQEHKYIPCETYIGRFVLV